jgi:hypothetical protein
VRSLSGPALLLGKKEEIYKGEEGREQCLFFERGKNTKILQLSLAKISNVFVGKLF